MQKIDKDLKAKIIAFRERTGLKTSGLAKAIGISNSAMKYLEDGTTKNPSVSVIRKMISVLKLNPYDLFELITGNIYTEKPNGSFLAELESLKKSLAKNENDFNEFKRLAENDIAEYKQREENLWNQINQKDRQISEKDEEIKSYKEHAGEAQCYLKEIAEVIKYDPKITTHIKTPENQEGRQGHGKGGDHAVEKTVENHAPE